MNFHESSLGLYQEHQDHFVFFGKKDANFENLKKSYPQFELIRMKQIHSNFYSETQSREDLKHEVDVLFTEQKNLALCCSTADCIPIFVYTPKEQKIFSIHAGWRGLANKIIENALKNTPIQETKIYIGPHIQQESFEVENDVRDQILGSVRDPQGAFFQLKSNKSLVDLHAIAIAQLTQLGFQKGQIISLKVDTNQDLRFHSYRRDKNLSGRQISFIVMPS